MILSAIMNTTPWRKLLVAIGVCGASAGISAICETPVQTSIWLFSAAFLTFFITATVRLEWIVYQSVTMKRLQQRIRFENFGIREIVLSQEKLKSIILILCFTEYLLSGCMVVLLIQTTKSVFLYNFLFLLSIFFAFLSVLSVIPASHTMWISELSSVWNAVLYTIIPSLLIFISIHDERIIGPLLAGMLPVFFLSINADFFDAIRRVSEKDMVSFGCFHALARSDCFTLPLLLSGSILVLIPVFVLLRIPWVFLRPLSLCIPFAVCEILFLQNLKFGGRYREKLTFLFGDGFLIFILVCENLTFWGAMI